MKTELEHAAVTWAIDEKGAIVGLEALTIDGVAQMATSFPSRFIFQSPEGWDYRSFRYLETICDGETITVRTAAIGTAADASWYRDQYDHDVLYVGRPRQAPALEVDFVLRAAAAIHDGVAFRGIHMDWCFRSESAHLGRLRWMQHWEMEGVADGTTLYWQSQIAPPVATFTRDSGWDNICWKSLQKEKTDANISMQLNARLAYHQLFDFLCAPRGVFLAYFPTAQTVQTLCRKNPGEDEFHVCESLEFPLADSGRIAGKTLLFAPGAGKSEATRRNLWFEINRSIEDSYREQTGIRKSRVLPTKTHWMWGAVPSDNHLCYDPRNTGEKIPAERYLEWLGEYEMPLAKAGGMRRFWTRPYCVSDASEQMFWNKSMQGRSVMDGDVTIGSCCCVREYKPSVMYGGGEMAKRFYELGREQGLEVGIWVGNHLSAKAPILKEHPEWVLKDRNFSNPAGGYDDLIMAVIDWNSGARDWILNDLKDWKKNYGLDFIFFDSLGNLGLKTRNFNAPGLDDNFKGLTRFAAELTHAGIEIICEGRSFIGAPHFGIANDGNMESAADPLRGQNSLGWYLGNEDMFCGMEAFTSHNPRVDKERLVTMHFRVLAGGGLLDITDGPEALTDHLRVYNRVAHHMKRRHLLEDDGGVVWADGDTTVFFAFKPATLALEGACRIWRVTPERLVELGTANQIEAEAQSVYVSNPRGAA